MSIYALQAVEDTPDTSVEVMCELPGRSVPLLVEFDWELDEVDPLHMSTCVTMRTWRI